jgi:hypothetical protein
LKYFLNKYPFNAKLLDSVPPEVKINSLGSQFIPFANFSLDSSIIDLAY